MSLSFFKKKRFYIPAIIVVIGGLLWYRSYTQSHKPIQYETVPVTRGDLVQTVEATGAVESVNDVSLRFEIPGTLATINVKEGDSVKAGQVLATLRLDDLNAALSQAQANLAQKEAPATSQDLSYYSAAVDSAKAAWDQSKSNAQNSISSAQSAVDTAQNNLQTAQGGDNSQIVTQAYSDSVAVLQQAFSKMDDALTQADNILGIDNVFANQDFKNSLSALNPNLLNVAGGYYNNAKAAKVAVHDAVFSLTTASNHANIDTALATTEDGLTKMNMLLSSVSDVLKATLPTGSLTQTSLDAKKTIIEATRSGIASQLTIIVNQGQAISNAKNSFNTYQIAYNKAQSDLATAQSNAQSSVAMAEAGYNQALANYQTKQNPPRAVDLAPLRALVAQAQANRDKAIILAPIDGIITHLDKKVGEMVSSADVAVEMLSPHFQVKVDIPETDVPKIKLNDTTQITLDAFGEDTKFTGTIIAIDPGSTNVQDVVYYTVTVGLDPTDKPIQSGMTANVSIKTDTRTGTLYIPLRTVLTNADGSKYVRVLLGKQETNTPVTLGLKADDGKVEITDGLAENQLVIVSSN